MIGTHVVTVMTFNCNTLTVTLVFVFDSDRKSLLVVYGLIQVQFVGLQFIDRDYDDSTLSDF